MKIKLCDSVLDLSSIKGPSVIECSICLKSSTDGTTEDLYVETIPVRIRTDKSNPNSVIVLQDAIRGLVDNISLEELDQTFCRKL